MVDRHLSVRPWTLSVVHTIHFVFHRIEKLFCFESIFGFRNSIISEWSGVKLSMWIPSNSEHLIKIELVHSTIMRMSIIKKISEECNEFEQKARGLHLADSEELQK